MSKLRKSARGRDCTVRILEYCNFDTETTVLAHLGGGGMGMKKPDETAGAFCCSDCHDVLDRRVPSDYSKDELELMHRRGIEKTQEAWFKEGLLKK